MIVLGLSCWYHDSAACLLKNGEIIAAAQEERFTRKKHDERFPDNAIKYCLDAARISTSEIDKIVFYEKPLLKFERLLETYFAYAPRGFSSFSKSMPLWLKEKLFQKQNLIKHLKDCLGKDVDWSLRLQFSAHHLSHAASAFYPSPFKDAAILTLDGVGEWSTSTLAVGSGKKIDIIKEINFPHSIGLLYSAFTYYTGFKVNSGEYKVMGLAPYGTPKYVKKIKENIVDIKDDGSFHLNMHFFNYAAGLTMTSPRFHKLFEGKPRSPESDLTQKHMDLAASIQVVVEEIVLKMAQFAASTTKMKNLCMAGGVALNCVANGLVARESGFKNIWIQPASGDAGGALGAAMAGYLQQEESIRIRPSNRKKDLMNGGYLGPSFNRKEIRSDLNAAGVIYHEFKTAKVIDIVASAIADQKAVGWMQGRMEFGPRALGNRSIIADPRADKMQRQLNLKVKFRESFRPFAPSVLSEHKSEWFELDEDSPYMLLVAYLSKEKQLKLNENFDNLFGIEQLNAIRSEIPAVTHVDFSARIQTVHKSTNLKYHQLIQRFFELTGCPILVNTSFNVRGEPIVCSPEDAIKCFMGTDLDLLVIENFILFKDEQDSSLKSRYDTAYELD